MNIQDLEKAYVEKLFSLVSSTLIKIETHAKKLLDFGTTMKLPSLVFAANQLVYLKKFGVSAINVGGTMGGGKSTVGEALAQKLSWEFVDADEFHPEANIEKQRRGEALTTEDRIPFLRAVRDFLASSKARISTCSALKSEYRAVLSGQEPENLAAGWDIKRPHYGLLQVLVYKPYAVTLEQLDMQSRGTVPKRLFKGQGHFINVTKESEEHAKAAGKFGILAAQFKDLETPKPYAWEAMLINVEDFTEQVGRYDLSKMLQPILKLIPA